MNKVQVTNTELCPDALEYLPHHGLLLVGAYELNKLDGSKRGALGLLRLSEPSIITGTSLREAPPGKVLWVPTDAVFDARWCRAASTCPILASALHTGVISFHSLQEDSGGESDTGDADLLHGGATSGDGGSNRAQEACLQPWGSPVQVSDNGSSALYVDWAEPASVPSLPDVPSLVSSCSDGRVAVIRWGEGGEPYISDTWLAHSLGGVGVEAWVACWDRSDSCPPASFVWSGGDDGILKGWDTRVQCTRPAAVCTSHAAGVTCLAWHPHAHSSHIFATGSYDEMLMLWDTRALARGGTRGLRDRPGRGLGRFNAGGGVWRMRWCPDPTRADICVVGCMYNGVHVVSFPGLTGGAPGAECIGVGAVGSSLQHYKGHSTLSYAVDWLAPAPAASTAASLIRAHDLSSGTDMNAWRIASAGFYDKEVHVWPSVVEAGSM